LRILKSEINNRAEGELGEANPQSAVAKLFQPITFFIYPEWFISFKPDKGDWIVSVGATGPASQYSVYCQ
jgi:hypothetical protein